MTYIKISNLSDLVHTNTTFNVLKLLILFYQKKNKLESMYLLKSLFEFISLIIMLEGNENMYFEQKNNLRNNTKSFSKNIN